MLSLETRAKATASITENLPNTMKVFWLLCAPFSLLFAVRILWEKTVWTIQRGPQMVGFSLFHIHPLFAIAGVLSTYGMLLWGVIALVYFAIRRRRPALSEIAMYVAVLFVLTTSIIPDNLFAR